MSNKLREILIIVSVASLFISEWYDYFQKRKLKSQPPKPEDLTMGQYRISVWERIFKIVLIFVTAFYALWILGLRRLINDELKKGADVRALIIVIGMAVGMIFIYYMILVISNRKRIDASMTKKPPKLRFIGYLKAVLIMIFFFILGYYLY